jgi:diguanylate cyclase (GGDEF)-like protein
MDLSLCARFGFDESRIREMLSACGLLGADNHVLVEELQKRVIGPNIGQIVDDFYAALGQSAEFTRVAPDPSIIDGLKRTQEKYLLSLGRDLDTPGYFEDRLRIGSTHQRVGISLATYQGFFCLLQTLLIDNVEFGQPEDDKVARELVKFIIRITSLDMALAIETYNAEKMIDLERSIHSARCKEMQLRHDLETDSLTGTYTRKYSLESLEANLDKAQQSGSPLSVVMADLDHFKQINDTYGHYVGDRLLKAVASRMMKASRETDVIGRYGGEEFMVIYCDTAIDHAVDLAKRMCQHISADPVHVDDHIVPITMSLGVAQAAPDDDAVSLAVRADKALYLAKESGRNTVRSELDPRP